MKSINRKIAPPFKSIDSVEKINYKKIKLNNGLPVTVLNNSNENVIRMEVVYNAGTKYTANPILPNITNNMLLEGTKKMSSKKLSEKIDYYGAYVFLNTDRDFASATLYSTNNFFKHTIKLFNDLLNNPKFSDKELNILLKNKLQNFEIDMQKVKTLSARAFNESVFGKEHYYGRTVNHQHFNEVDSQQLNTFYTRLYNKNNCRIILSGNINNEVISILNSEFNVENSNVSHVFSKQKPVSFVTKKIFIEKPEAVQSSIRIGKIAVNKNHSDFIGLQVLNTILGGYFGSRLMSNLREDKGYTYGVGSAVASFTETGFFTTVCEVGVQYTKQAINEIYKEFNRLINELVSESELKRVKNYMLGIFLRTFDGPYAQLDAFRSIDDYNLKNSFFKKYIETVKTITPIQIRNLSEKYLQPSSMFEIVAGKI